MDPLPILFDIQLVLVLIVLIVIAFEEVVVIYELKAINAILRAIHRVQMVVAKKTKKRMTPEEVVGVCKSIETEEDGQNAGEWEDLS